MDPVGAAVFASALNQLYSARLLAPAALALPDGGRGKERESTMKRGKQVSFGSLVPTRYVVARIDSTGFGGGAGAVFAV